MIFNKITAKPIDLILAFAFSITVIVVGVGLFWTFGSETYQNCSSLIESTRILLTDAYNPESFDLDKYFWHYWDLEAYQCDKHYDKEKIKFMWETMRGKS